MLIADSIERMLIAIYIYKGKRGVTKIKCSKELTHENIEHFSSKWNAVNNKTKMMTMKDANKQIFLEIFLNLFIFSYNLIYDYALTVHWHFSSGSFPLIAKSHQCFAILNNWQNEQCKQYIFISDIFTDQFRTMSKCHRSDVIVLTVIRTNLFHFHFY